jgi:hypothetical protein
VLADTGFLHTALSTASAQPAHLPLVQRMKPRVSMATPVLTTRSPMYQLMKLDLPAEWLPTIITLSSGGVR